MTTVNYGGMAQQTLPQTGLNQPAVGVPIHTVTVQNTQPIPKNNPNYTAQMQAGRQADLEIQNSNLPTMATGKRSQKIQCPYCGKVGLSNVEYKSRGWSLVLLIILAIIFFPLVLLYILCPQTFCPGATHYCSSCGREVGKVYKWC